MDCSLPGSSLHGILQPRILEWVAISFSRDLPNPGIEPGSPTLRADALRSEPPGKPNCKGIYSKSFTSTLGLVSTGLLLVNISLTSQCLGTYVLRAISFWFNPIYFSNLHVDKVLQIDLFLLCINGSNSICSFLCSHSV